MSDDAAAFQAVERARAMAKRARKKKTAPTPEASTAASPGMGEALSGAGPSARDPQPLGGLAAQLLELRGWKEVVEDAAVEARWAEIVGPQLAERTKVESLEDGKLVVRAATTAWATQVKLLRSQLRARIAEVLGGGVVEEIVVLGPAGPSWSHGTRSVKGRGPRDTYG